MKKVNDLIVQFNDFQSGYAEPLTFEECSFVLDHEDHEAFMYDFGLYREILDYRDYLELES
jgi:hypothetical protein